jgi:hypothetical protein
VDPNRNWLVANMMKGTGMTESRGRQARLKPGLGKLYPGLEAGAWRTVEDLLRHVAILVDKRLADPRTITGERLLREDHFEFRGDSARPEGWPVDLSRMADAAAPPVPREEERGETSGRSNDGGKK